MRKILNGEELISRINETRIIEKFLLFPKTINHELRWLEHVKIKQKICAIDIGGSMEYGKYKYAWRNWAWAN
jgi:hypothetical protein